MGQARYLCFGEGTLVDLTVVFNREEYNRKGTSTPGDGEDIKAGYHMIVPMTRLRGILQHRVDQRNTRHTLSSLAAAVRPHPHIPPLVGIV